MESKLVAPLAQQRTSPSRPLSGLLAPETPASAVSAERSNFARLPTRRPRIAFLGSRGIPARYGGFETFVEELSVRLVERGIDVTVFCEGDAREAERSFRGVQLEHVRAWAPGPLRTLAFDAQCLARSLRGFDVVYMLGYGSSALCSLPRLAGRDVWINMDGLEWRRSKWSPAARAWLWAMEKLAFHCASHLVFDNAALRERVAGTRRKSASVIEYGAPIYTRDDESGVLARFGLQAGRYLLAVARLEPENHLIEIVRAHRESGSERDLALVTNVERGGDYARALADAAGARTRILGSVYDASVLRPLRRHAHAYVHGHSVGGTNPSLLESMGCANVVVAHDNPFNRETLAGNGLFWSDERELAQRLVECESLARSDRERLREAVLARAREQYGWERIAERYAALIRERCA